MMRQLGEYSKNVNLAGGNFRGDLVRSMELVLPEQKNRWDFNPTSKEPILVILLLIEQFGMDWKAKFTSGENEDEMLKDSWNANKS